MRKVLYILGQLREEDIQWLSQNGEKTEIEENTVLIEEGKFVDNIYIVLEGELTVYQKFLNNREITVLMKGEIVGEMSFVDASPPGVSVKAGKKSLLLKISKPILNKKLSEDREFAARFYKAISIFLSARLRATMNDTLTDKDIQVPEGFLETDELDDNVLDNISLAGEKFDRLIEKLKE